MRCFRPGGGVAGIAAAVSAARGGAKVILADNNGYLGGSATAGMVGTFMTCLDTRGEKQIIKGFSNLLVAGRCLSADRFALAAVRVMPPCFAMGEAVGVTAALALGCDSDVNAVPAKEVQRILIENGGYLD